VSRVWTTGAQGACSRGRGGGAEKKKRGNQAKKKSKKNTHAPIVSVALTHVPVHPPQKSLTHAMPVPHCMYVHMGVEQVGRTAVLPGCPVTSHVGALACTAFSAASAPSSASHRPAHAPQ